MTPIWRQTMAMLADGHHCTRLQVANSSSSVAAAGSSSSVVVVGNSSRSEVAAGSSEETAGGLVWIGARGKRAWSTNAN